MSGSAFDQLRTDAIRAAAEALEVPDDTDGQFARDFAEGAVDAVFALLGQPGTERAALIEASFGPPLVYIYDPNNRQLQNQPTHRRTVFRGPWVQEGSTK